MTALQGGEYAALSGATAWLNDATWLPHLYDPHHDTLMFAHLPREAQRLCVFLDTRFVRRPTSPRVPIRDLAALAKESARPMHFIFHVGFCCSTLLARALDIPGVSMGLKEPSAIACFTRDAQARRASLGVTLDLLSRPLADGETQTLKASNICNSIIRDVLELRPGSKALLLCMDQRSFIGAIARRGAGGGDFARAFSQELAPLVGLQPALDLPPRDLRFAATLWRAQMRLFRDAETRFGCDRVRTITADSLLAEPARALSATAQFFDLPLSPDAAAAITAGPVFKEYSKGFGSAFDANTYHAQREATLTDHATEINQVMSWSEAFAGATDALPRDTLLA